jgi:hypothetical protein
MGCRERGVGRYLYGLQGEGSGEVSIWAAGRGEWGGIYMGCRGIYNTDEWLRLRRETELRRPPRRGVRVRAYAYACFFGG